MRPYHLPLLLMLATAVQGGEVMVQLAGGTGGAQNGEGYLYQPGWTMGAVRHLAEGSPYGAVLADGSLLCWAYGMGLGTSYPTPVISDGQQMLLGTQFALVRRGDGSVIGWGNPTHAGENLPVPALGGLAIDIAMGWNFAAALLSDGRVVTWGSNAPAIPVDARFTAIEANSSCLIGLRADGALRAYGVSGASFNMPAELAVDAAGVQMISGAYNYTAALTADGRILAWGPGPLSKSWTGPFNLVSVGASAVLGRRTSGAVVRMDVYSTSEATIAAAAGATQLRAVSTTGIHCRLADGSLLLTDTNPPVDGPPVGLDRMQGVTAGGGTCIGVQSDGHVAVWGVSRGRWGGIAYANVVQAQPSQANSRLYLLLADGTLQRGYSGSFTQVLTGVRTFDTYDDYAVAVKTDGTVAVTGYSGSQVWAVPAGLSGVSAVATGNDFAVALKADGTVAPWGAGTGGQVPPVDLGDVSQLDCGWDHVIALRRDGTVRCWGGSNASGQRTVPAGLSGVVQVAADGLASFALKADGTVVQWGEQRCTPASLAAITHAGEIHCHNVLLANRNLRPRFLAPPRSASDGHVLLDVVWNWPVTGFATNDVTVSNGTLNAVTGSGTTWQLDVSPTSPGSVTVAIAGAAVASDPGWASLPASTAFTALALSASAATASTAEVTPAIITLPNPNPVAVTYQIVANPTHGGVSAFIGNQITYTPADGWVGDDTFTYRVTNGAYWSSPATVTVTVVPVNRAPTLAAPGDVAVLEDAGQTTATLSGIGPGRASESGQTLTVTASSSAPGIVPDPTVTYASPQTVGSLAIAPVANAVGSAVITVTVRDSGGTADGGVDTVSRSFTVTVGPVNDPPTLAFIAGISVAEDAPAQTVTLSGISVGPANEAGQVLTPVAFSTAPSIVGHPTIDYAGGTTATLHWQPLADAHGQARIFVTFADDGGTANGGADSVSQSFLIDVTPVNDAPVLAVHATVSPVVSTTVTIGSDVLKTTDVDVPPAASLVYTLTVAPPRGQLLLSGSPLAAGGTFTQADIVANHLTFLAGAVVGDASFSFTVSDGLAAALPASTLTITIQPSGGGGATPPLVTLDLGVITYVEGASALLVSPGATVADSDSPDFNGGSLRVELTQNGTAADRLQIVAGGRVSLSGSTVLVDGANVGTASGGVGLAALQVACSASATAERIQALLRCIAFSNVSNAPSDLERCVQVVVSDGDGGDSVPASRQIAVQTVNTPPSLALPSAAVAFTEGGGAVAIDPTALASDDDSAVIDGGRLQVTITTNGDPADRLQLANDGLMTVSGSTVSYDGAVVGTWSTGDSATPLRVDFAGAAATPAVAQAVLRGVRFANASTAPGAAPRTLRATLSDGQDTSAAATVVVAVATLNDPPAITLPDAPLFAEAGGAVALSPNATLTDPDSADFAGGGFTIRISAGAHADDVLLVVHQGDGAGQVGVGGAELRYGGAVIGTAVGGSGFAPLVVSFDSVAVTPAVALAVLKRLGFDNSSSNPVAGTRTVAVRAGDGDGSQSSEVVVPLTVTDINAAPTLTASGTTTWTEDTAAVAVAPAAVIADGDSADFAGGSLSAGITGNAAGDRLRIRHVGSAAGQVGVAGDRILVGGDEVGTWSGGDGGTTLVVAFAGAAATPAAAEAVARQIVFDSTSQNPPAARRTIDLTVNDGDGDASPAASVAVDVVPVDDAPSLDQQTIAVFAGAQATVVLTGSDPEGDASDLILVAAPDAASGTLSVIDAAAHQVRFEPAAGFVGTTTFTVRLHETVSDLLTSADRVITVRVTGADEARPLAASEPPREAFRGRPWLWTVRFDTTGLADADPLSLALEDAPAGMQLAGSEVQWQVPADQALGVLRFGLRCTTATGVAGWQEVLILLRPAPGGGG